MEDPGAMNKLAPRAYSSSAAASLLMVPHTLSSLVDGFGTGASPSVLARENGIWGQERARFGDEVRGLAAALSTYGLHADALDPALSDDALRRALASTGAVHAIASDERQLARILALRPDLPALELVLLMSAAPSDRKPAALLVETAMEVGAASLVADPRLLQRALSESTGLSCCVLVDDAGATQPVGRTALLAMAEAIAQALGLARGKTVLAALPVGGIERLAASLAALGRGVTLLLPDPGERPDAGLDRRPADAVLLNVTTLGRLHRAWTEDIEAKSWIGREVTRWALRQGQDSEHHGWKHRLAEGIALRGLRYRLGGRAATLDVMATDGSRASANVGSFFAAAGLPIRYIPSQPAAALAR
jgi:long-subunit acyl-CoA synthetase (AMP-forming)